MKYIFTLIYLLLRTKNKMRQNNYLEISVSINQTASKSDETVFKSDEIVTKSDEIVTKFNFYVKS